MAGSDWVSQLKEIASDLTAIEINTIAASGMTGRKMPPWPHALIDIGQKYADFLTGHSVRLDLDAFREDYLRVSAIPPSAENENEEASPARELRDMPLHFKAGDSFYTFQLTNGEETFDMLRWAAGNVLAMSRGRGPAIAAPSALHGPPPEMDDATRTILIRIQRSCDQLKVTTPRLREAAKDFVGVTRAELQELEDAGRTTSRAAADTMTLIRKIWDIGADQIIMQTVVQLDGDVIFRARRDALAQANQVFAQAHERATSTALGHWHNLFNLITGLLRGRGGQVLERDDNPGRE
jgi:hypothetical protein